MPAKSFAPNAFGVFTMLGNVWNWCADPFKIRSISAGAKLRNSGAGREKEKLKKGGSFYATQAIVGDIELKRERGGSLTIRPFTLDSRSLLIQADA